MAGVDRAAISGRHSVAGMTYVSAHFSVNEFRCQDAARTGYPVAWRDTRLVLLCQSLETIRERLNEQEPSPVKLVITSGYRTPEYNAAIGGAKRSQHIEGRAADIVAWRLVPGGNVRHHGDWRRLTCKKLGAVVADLMRGQWIPPGGIGYYASFIHVDVRGSRRSFGPNRPRRIKK
jgi:hypothetical protein